MNLITWLSKVFYWPIVRSYARHLGDKPADALLRCLCVSQFWRFHHYWPNLENPRTFSEKIWHRMFYDRDPRFTLISDKWRVRNYVGNKAGNNYLIPLLWHGSNPDDIPFNTLENQFVIKVNHGCGYNIIVQDKTKLDITETKKQLKYWLDENFCQDKYFGITWAYKNITPHIMIESFIGINGQVPIDYKFFCYNGRAEFVQTSFDRFGDASEKFLDRNFMPLDVWNGLKLFKGDIVKPDNYDAMLLLADKLSHDFNFMRVDLYSSNDRIYFGELTCYPAGGLAPFIPKKYDYIFGEKWQIKAYHRM